MKIVEKFYGKLYSNLPKEIINQKTHAQSNEQIAENRAPGRNNIVIEAAKLEEPTLKQKINFFKSTSEPTHNIPRLEKSVDKILNKVLLHKKIGIIDLEIKRPISLLNHLYKLLTRMITI